MAGTVTLTNIKAAGHVSRVKITCTADAADGSFPSTDLLTLITSQTSGKQIEGQLTAVAADIGGTAPTAGWGVALTRYGSDLLEGQCASMPATDRVVTLRRPVLIAGDAASASYDTITIDITRNAVNSAVIVLYLWYAKRVS